MSDSGCGFHPEPLSARRDDLLDLMYRCITTAQLGKPNPSATLQFRRVMNNAEDSAGGIKVEAFTCSKCRHVQFFKAGKI
jgi:hypothetical protein